MTIEPLIVRYGLIALFLGAGLEGETVVVAGGLLAHEGYFPLTAAMIAAATGSFVADQLFFAAGRRFREHRWVAKVRGKAAFAKALAMFEAHPIGFIFAFRFIYGFRVAAPVALGTSRVPSRTFWIVNAAAAALWGVMFSSIGYLFGTELEAWLGKLKPTREHLLLGLVAAIILFVAVHAIVAWRKEGRE